MGASFKGQESVAMGKEVVYIVPTLLASVDRRMSDTGSRSSRRRRPGLTAAWLRPGEVRPGL